MEDKNKDIMQPADKFLMEEPPLMEEPVGAMPELTLDSGIDNKQHPPKGQEEVVLLDLNIDTDTISETHDAPVILSGGNAEMKDAARDAEVQLDVPGGADPEPADHSDTMHFELPLSGNEVFEPGIQDAFLYETAEDDSEAQQMLEADFEVPAAAESDGSEQEEHYSPPPTRTDRPRPIRKGRPKRKKGYGLFGIPHLLATLVWLAIIVVIGTSLGRMIWVCAADVLAFGRESKKVSVTITSNDTIEDIAQKLHDAELIRYPGLFELYASIAVDEGDIIPGTFEMDTLYDYHALVVQMGPRSSNRTVVEDLLIPEGLNCRQIFELLEQNNVCTVAELEEYAANGEFSDFWFLEGVERGDKYCLEGFLFPDTYDFYANSTPREALGKMLLGFESRFTEEIYAQLPALNERLSTMMRNKGCSEEHIAENQLDLRDLLTVASLIEEETASAKESPTIASVIFNRLTEDQMYERYLGIDAALIYATGDADNIDTTMDHPYNTYINPGLTPGPISNPGLDSINAALNFEDTQYYYYVLNPETGTHQFSRTLAEHEQWVAQFRGND